jgi:hypothetical protein
VYCTNSPQGGEAVVQEYKVVSSSEDISRIAQESLNLITDTSRTNRFSEKGDNIESKYAIEQISMININTFLARKERVFLQCMFKPFEKKGIITFLDLVREAETEMNRVSSKTLEAIIKAFPPDFRDAANSFNEDINNYNNKLTHIEYEGKWLPTRECTTKEFQNIFKKILNKTSETDFQAKLDIESCEDINIVKFRKGCKNPKLRHIHFRLIHNDFFTYQRMFKYGMTNSPNCPRCNNEESTKHLLWDCVHSQNIWTIFNEILGSNNLASSKVSRYEHIYRTENNSAVSVIKLKIIQQMIQMERPKNWEKVTVQQLIIRIKDYETKNASDNYQNAIVLNKWKAFSNL